MSPTLLSWALKKLLQRYLGEYLSSQVSLDQLSMELSEGSAQMSSLDMNTSAINQNLARLNIPLELVDGWAGLIKIDIPWLKLINDPTKVTVEELQLTFQKAKDATYSSILLALSPKEIAESVLEMLFDQGPSGSNDVTEFFTKLVKSVFSRFCVEFRKVTIRFENDDEMATALEFRIDKVLFTYEKSESPEFQKKFEIEGISLYTDISSKFPTHSKPTTSESKDSESDPHSIPLEDFQTCLETMTSESRCQTPEVTEEPSEAPEPQGTPEPLSDPIKILEITGPVHCLFKTTYNSDNDKKTLTSIDIKISINTSIDIFGSLSQLEIVKKSIDSLIPLSVAQGRPMTDNDFEVMNQSLKESSSIRSHHEESQLISLSVEASSLNLCIPQFDPLINGDSESLNVLRQDSEDFFTDKTSYHKDHFLITSESINLKIGKSPESLKLEVSSGAFRIDGLDSKLLEVLSVDINFLSVDEKVIKIDMKLGDCRSDFKVREIPEILKVQSFFKEKESCTAPTTPLKFHVTCPSYLTTFQFDAEQQVQLTFKELSVDVDKNPNILITASLSEANGSYHLQEIRDFCHITKATLILIKGHRDSDSDDDEEEDAEDLDDLLESSFSSFRKIPGPFSQVPKSYNAENGDVVELLPPGTRKEMLEFHEESLESSGNQMKLQIQSIQIHAPEKSELEKLYKLSREILKMSSESAGLQNPQDPFTIGIDVADSVILLNTMNPTTQAASQVSLRLQNLHFGGDSEYLHLTSSGVIIGFCADALIPRILGQSDFGTFSKHQIQMSRRQKCNEDVLAVAIGTPGSLQKIVSVALRNSRIQARPVKSEEPEAFWGMQLMDLFGFLDSEEPSESKEDPIIQLSLEYLQIDYDHGWIHPGSEGKLAGLLEKATVIRRSAKKISPLLFLLENIKLHLIHPSITHAQVLESGSIQLELFTQTNTIRCATDLLKASMTSDELAIFVNLMQEYTSWQFPGVPEKPEEPAPEDVEKQARIEEMIRDAINQEGVGQEYHRQDLFVVDEKLEVCPKPLEPSFEAMGSRILLDSDSELPPESDPVFQLHLTIGKVQGSLLNRQTSESVILELDRVTCIQKLYNEPESLENSIYLKIANFSVKDRISSSDIDSLAYPIFTSDRRNQRSAIQLHIDLNQDKTGRVKVSLPDIKMNLDQDTVEFLGKYLEQCGARWELETVDVECSVKREDGFVLMDRSGFRRQNLLQKTSLTYFKHFVFSPEVKICIDYHGKSKMPRDSNLFDLFQGLVQLQGLPITLDKIDTRKGFLGVKRLLEHVMDHWKAARGLGTDVTTVVSSFTPIRPIVRSLVDLISHPVAEYQKPKNGNLLRGIGRGVGAFGVSSASGVIGMAQTVTGAVQTIAEYGAANAPTTSRSRKSRSTLLPTIVSVTQATHNLLGGLRGHICPDDVRDEKRKYGDGKKKIQ